MKRLIAALAMSVIAMPFASAQIQVKEVAPITAQTKTPQAETSGGKAKDPDPHIYKLGEHLSEAYGRFELVDDWKVAKLEMPPEGHHWVRYGDNFMLVTATDGLIKRIVRAS